MGLHDFHRVLLARGRVLRSSLVKLQHFYDVSLTSTYFDGFNRGSI